MTRETKLGLLVGVGIILLIGIIVSDHLSVSKQPPPPLTNFANEASNALAGNSGATPASGTLTSGTPAPAPGTPVTPGAAPAAGDRPMDASPGTTGTPGALPTDRARGPVEAARTTGDGTPMPGAAGSDRSATDLRLALGDTRRPGDPLPLFDPPTTGSSGVRDSLAMRDTGTTSSGLGLPPVGAGRGLTSSGSGAAGRDASISLTDPNSLIHYVAKGDTLYTIAKKYYNNAEQWRVIADANKGKIGPKGELREGVRLAIPSKPKTPATSGGTTLAGDTSLFGGDRLTGTGLDRPRTGAGIAAGSDRTIKVEAGDTLSKIAAKHLGSSAKWQDLLKANSDQLKSAKELKPGMLLRLPAGKATSDIGLALGPTTRPGNDTAIPPFDRTVRGDNRTAPPAAGKTYTVQPGDTLAVITKKTMGKNAKWQDLLAANKGKLSKPEALKPGMVLNIPDGKTTTVTTTPPAPARGTPPLIAPFDTGDRALGSTVMPGAAGRTGRAPAAPGAGAPPVGTPGMAPLIPTGGRLGGPTIDTDITGPGAPGIPGGGTLMPITADPADRTPATAVATRLPN